ncbi:MAG: hypothetical protein KUG77_28485 [Nannocystaceae bacterium]|nr:hypothetical protein [Nannocystaceae bacterium]
MTARAPWLLALSLVPAACTDARETPAPPQGMTTAGDETGTVPTGDETDDDESSSSGDGSSSSGGPDVPAPECASISASTEIEDRPSDIIVIADDDIDRQFVKDNITNLLPGMETQGVFDATVTLVVAGEPPPAVKGDKYACGAWNCRGASSFAGFTVYDRSVPSDGVLTALLETREDWSSALREDSWKHVWVMSSTVSDATTSPEDFLDAFDDGYIVHVVVTADGRGDPAGYEGLTEQTGGAYSQGDYNLGDFQDPMIERIQGTALACEYEIPEPPGGLLFARDKVNVLYDEGQGPLPVGYVESPSQCLTAGYGWHYDDAEAPTQIVMCPESCERFAMLTNATIDIEFGCDTIPAA